MASDFTAKMEEIISNIRTYEKDNIHRAAEILADTVKAGGTLYTFGTGHSFSVALEAVGKRGSLETAKLLDEHIPNLARFERLPGLGPVILKNYDLKPTDTVFVVSNSGRYPLTVEVAAEAKKRGAKVISISAHAVKKELPSLAESGKYLSDVSDVAIDNHGLSSDLLVDIPEYGLKVGSPSTLTGIYIYYLILEKMVDLLVESKVRPPLIKG
ncbi:MAG: sugar isomerase domain-containing protein [Bacillota bacterium]|jgi:uncharacterized phosphosugar-binding protein|nr:sugar isomerase domain-containing protein [Bacillota bacterium]NLU54882.1 sugar isomerase domain-containing protein [Bacillota bacterium]HOA90762.1 sugar isomerase domain-containing protein [Bacillota bacterium]HOL13116.1 sugar isomerase domain-containing protein [Bacillota bacterium]HPT61684.1 sugar isomerase domain-containing protein [Bacillota bacterium]